MTDDQFVQFCQILSYRLGEIRDTVHANAEINGQILQLLQSKGDSGNEEWKKNNEQLSKTCRRAAEVLGKVQSNYIRNLAEEIIDSEDEIINSDYLFSEIIDNNGHQMQHLNLMCTVFTAMGS